MDQYVRWADGQYHDELRRTRHNRVGQLQIPVIQATEKQRGTSFNQDAMLFPPASSPCHPVHAASTTRAATSRYFSFPWFDQAPAYLTWHNLHFFLTGPAGTPLATVYSWHPMQRVCNAILVFGGSGSVALCL